jgi:outer membrane protein
MKSIKINIAIVLLVIGFSVNAQERRLSLEEALSVARKNNKSLQIKSLDVENSRERFNVVKSNMLPTINAAASYSYYFDRQVIFMPGAFTGDEDQPVVDVAVGGKNAFNTYLTLSQPLMSEANRRQLRTAKLDQSIQELSVQDFRSTLTVDVTALYYQALLISESIKLNQQSLARNVHALNDSKSLYAQGKSLKIDTLRNYVTVENLTTTIAHLESQHAIALLKLGQLIGINDTTIVLTDSLKADVEQRYFTAVQVLSTETLQNRPDLQIRGAQVQMVESKLRTAKAERLPTLNLLASYQLQAQADNREIGNYRWPKTSFVGIQANIPIFAGGKINARARQAKTELKRQELELQDATEQASTQIATLESNLRELVQRLEVHRKTVDAAEINYTITNDRYKNGLSSRLELTDAELALTEARLSELQTIFRVKITKLELDRALGIFQY